jgi:RNA polymerase sigma-70 factor (ECF subfamily)
MCRSAAPPFVIMASPHQRRLAGLDALDALDTDALRGYHLLPAARADLLRRLGRTADAAAAYRAALELVGNDRERAYLQNRLEEL